MKAVRRIAMFLGPILVLIGATGFLAYRFAVNERLTQEWLVHTYQVIGKGNDVMTDLLNAETGERGFAITGQNSYLAPYRAGAAAFDRDIDALQSLTSDNAEQQQRIVQLRKLAHDRIALLDQGIEAARAKGQADAQELMLSDSGRELMDQMRQLVSQILVVERHLLGERNDEARRSERQTIALTSAAAAAALLILLVSTGLLARSNFLLEKSEAQRGHQAKLLQATLDNTREGLAVFDFDGNLCASNKPFFELLHVSDHHAHEKSTLRVIRADIPPPVDRFFDFATDGGSDSMPALLNVTLGDRHLELYRNSVPDIGYLIACADVTARVRAENIARQTQKMEAVGHLTGGVAHDFNNLLQVINANLDLLAPSVAGDPRAVQRLKNAMYGVERGTRLTRQLLAFARRQPLEPRSINLGRLIQEMTDLLRRSLGEHIEIETIIGGGLWNTLVDPVHVESAVLNLAINARDAMQGGGKLTIEISNAFLDDAYARENPEAAAGQYVLLAVSDTGMGMSAETMEHAFEPFFSTKPEGEGTGLGLSQVYGFVKQSGGHIKLYSEAGEGTAAKLYLPRTRRPQEHIDRPHPAPLEGGTESILVVEDDEAVRTAVVDMLCGLGYCVSNAGNAEAALDILRNGPKVDLLFTDVVMPGPIHTREFAHKAMALQLGLVVLYTSGYTQNAIVHNGRLDNDVALLSKPYSRDELARKIREILGTRRNAAPSAHAGANAAPPAQTRKRKVLIVEDEALIRMTTEDMLEQLGYEFVGAGSGEEALAKLEAEDGIDVILTDLGLPGISGHDLVAEARTRRPGIKVVVASGYPRGHERTNGLPSDVVFLGKPFQMSQLGEAIA